MPRNYRTTYEIKIRFVALFSGSVALNAIYKSPLLYFIYVGAGGQRVGPLLWPGVAVHAILIVLLGIAWSKQRNSAVTS